MKNILLLLVMFPGRCSCGTFYGKPSGILKSICTQNVAIDDATGTINDLVSEKHLRR
ncbi:MAG: hypothetical protein IPN26_00030 [Bacteroidetes bacterium]|nr:hypothetical protein [Bacteroidota bacterium]